MSYVCLQNVKMERHQLTGWYVSHVIQIFLDISVNMSVAVGLIKGKDIYKKSMDTIIEYPCL